MKWKEISTEREWYLVIWRERNGNSATAEDGTGVAAVGDDNFVPGEDGDDSSGSNCVAVRSLELAPTVESLAGLTPAEHLFIHASETALHQCSPVQSVIPLVNLFVQNLV